jgi:hypothetical protein
MTQKEGKVHGTTNVGGERCARFRAVVVVVRTTTAILLASRRERSYSSCTEDGYEQDDMECQPSAPWAFRHGGVCCVTEVWIVTQVTDNLLC